MSKCLNEIVRNSDCNETDSATQFICNTKINFTKSKSIKNKKIEILFNVE